MKYNVFQLLKACVDFGLCGALWGVFESFYCVHFIQNIKETLCIYMTVCPVPCALFFIIYITLSSYFLFD